MTRKKANKKETPRCSIPPSASSPASSPTEHASLASVSPPVSPFSALDTPPPMAAPSTPRQTRSRQVLLPSSYKPVDFNARLRGSPTRHSSLSPVSPSHDPRRLYLSDDDHGSDSDWELEMSSLLDNRPMHSLDAFFDDDDRDDTRATVSLPSPGKSPLRNPSPSDSDSCVPSSSSKGKSPCHGSHGPHPRTAVSIPASPKTDWSRRLRPRRQAANTTPHDAFTTTKKPAQTTNTKKTSPHAPKPAGRRLSKRRSRSKARDPS
ncbi:hypothetical protein BC940DRAFT_136699 [Gongronella butleri]|nr:hypothetical protein BC940DRAFT_136699 [Gongronella butleri]